MILDDNVGKKFKYCPDCRQDLPAEEFHKDARRKDGLGFYCAKCANIRQLESRRRRLGPRRRRVGPPAADIAPDMKWCPECNEIKPHSDFPRNRSQRSGYGSYCRPCHNRITREDKEKHGGARNYHLRRRYGITVEHFDAMLAAQGGLCAICQAALAGHVDHDHATGRVRGLLCFNCNGALGQFRDRADLMLRAVAYLDGIPAGTYVGDFSSPRPAYETWEAGFVA